MATFLFLIHAALIFSVARNFWKNETSLKVFFWPALALKLIAGVSLGLVYTYYYSTADTFEYFEDGSQLAGLALTDFSAWLKLLFYNHLPESLHLTFYQPRALFLTKITSIFNIITGNNYWIIGAYYSALCFSGAWCLVKIIDHHVPAARRPAILAFLFLPSVVFWTSGLLKESLAVAALYYLTALFLRIWFNEKVRFLHVVTGAVSLWIFWNLKYYYAAVFLPIVSASLLYKFAFPRRAMRSVAAEALIWLALLTLPLIAITFTHPNFYPHRLFNVILMNNAAYNALSDPDRVVHFHHLQPTAISLAENAPWALFSGLFRPLLGEASALMPFLSSLENTLVLVFFAAAVFGFRKYFPSPHRLLILALVAYVVLLCILLTYSAPNLGTLSRYRSGYFSFFVFIILCGNPLLRYVQRSFRRLVSH